VFSYNCKSCSTVPVGTDVVSVKAAYYDCNKMILLWVHMVNCAKKYRVGVMAAYSNCNKRILLCLCVVHCAKKYCVFICTVNHSHVLLCTSVYSIH